jgi:cell division protein FtsB
MFAAALAALAFSIASTVYCFEIRKMLHLHAVIAERSAKLTEKQRRVGIYRDLVEFYNTDEGIAHLARDEYNMTFPGERVYIIITSGDAGASPPRGASSPRG